MAEIERGRLGMDEERLPWLEAVDDEDARTSPGIGRLVAAVLVALVAIGLTVGGVFWLRDRNRAGGADGPGELIAAPAGPYKTKPGEPGGMQVEGQGETAYAASEGTETNAAIDLNALPETPVTDETAVTSADATAAPRPTPAANAPAPPPVPTRMAAAAPAKPAPVAKPAPPTASVAPEPPASGGTIQLGAFSSEAKANAAWKALSGRFAFLAPLDKAVVPVKAGSATLYRLRVTAGGQAGTICGKLKVAGETCARIGS